jgi:lipopolysaccharide export LptBFGC system permease protein LptF
VLAMSLLLVYFNMNLTPVANREFRKIFKEVMTQRPLLKFEDNSISSIGEYKIYVKEVDKNSDRLLGVNIYKFAPSQSDAALRITASSAIVTADARSVVFTLYSGYWQKPDANNHSDFIYLRFQRYQFVIQMASNMIPFSQSTQEMSGAELLKEMDSYRQRKLPTTALEVQFWLRWTLAFSPILMALMGIPLGIVLERGGKSIGFGVSMLVLFGYYVLLVTGMNLGEKGYFPPGVIAWLPNIVSLIVGFLLWRRMLKK